MSDIEDIEDIEEITYNTDSIADVTKSVLTKLDWFLLFIIAISFLFVISDVFIKHLLVKFPDAVKYEEPTAWGSIIQMMSQIFILIGASSIRNYW